MGEASQWPTWTTRRPWLLVSCRRERISWHSRESLSAPRRKARKRLLMRSSGSSSPAAQGSYSRMRKSPASQNESRSRSGWVSSHTSSVRSVQVPPWPWRSRRSLKRLRKASWPAVSESRQHAPPPPPVRQESTERDGELLLVEVGTGGRHPGQIVVVAVAIEGDEEGAGRSHACRVSRTAEIDNDQRAQARGEGGGGRLLPLLPFVLWLLRCVFRHSQSDD